MCKAGRQGGEAGRRAVLAALLAGPLAGGAGAPGGADGVAAEVDAAADAELGRRPALYVNGGARGWAVSRGGRAAGVLWGTLHVRYEGGAVLPDAMRARLQGAAGLVVEKRAVAGPLPVRDAAADAADPAALDALGPGTRAALRAAGIGPADEARSTLLGLARLVLARAPGWGARPTPQGQVVDARLIAMAEGAGLPVRTLEAMGAEPPPPYGPNSSAAADILRLALRRRDAAALLPGRMLAYYGRDEVGRMLAAAAAWRAEPADLRHADAARAALIGARNRAWLEPLEAALALPGEQFAAFGCGHLPGGDGVVALLRERGWGVEALG